MNPVHQIQNTVDFARMYSSPVLRCKACINTHQGIFMNTNCNDVFVYYLSLLCVEILVLFINSFHGLL